MIHFIIARYQEKVDWLFDIFRTQTQPMHATIYNDGGEIIVPFEMTCMVDIVKGDKIPCEPTKYIKYILDNYECIKQSNDTFVFLQGDPLYHNPTLPNCFKHIDKWDNIYQNLALYAHPPPWGCAHAIITGKAPNVTTWANDAMVWHDIMKDDLQGEYFYDPFWVHLHTKKDINIPYFALYFGFTKPHTMKKSVAACFATSSSAISQIPKCTWQKLHDFVQFGCSKTSGFSQKTRAVYMEYLWAVILEADWSQHSTIFS